MYLSRCSGETFRTSATVFYHRNCSQPTELQDTFKINEKKLFLFLLLKFTQNPELAES